MRASIGAAFGLALLAVPSCSSDGSPFSREAPALAEAGATASSAPPDALAKAVELAAAHPSLADMLAPRPEGLVRIDGALRYSGRAAGGTMAVRMAETADGGIDVTPPSRDHLRLIPEGAAAVPARVHEGRVLYEGVQAATDLVAGVGPDRVELAMLLHGPEAPSSFVWHVERDAGLDHVRFEPTGAVVFESMNDDAMLRIAAPFAIDAQGTRHEAEMTLVGDRLVIRLETANLVYPVLLDPAIETAFWTPLPIGGPPGRASFGMTYDTTANESVVYGGELANGAPDVHVYELASPGGAAWNFIGIGAPNPGNRRFLGMAYDALHNNHVIFGGTDNVNQLADTWTLSIGGVFTPKCGTTSPATAACGPSARSGMGLAYDSTRQVVVMFGGFPYTADTWEWNGTTWTARCGTTTPPTAACGPSARGYLPLAFDGSRGKTVLFGGQSGSPLGDTWEWDGATWTARCGTSSPPTSACAPGARYRQAMSYDPARRRTIMFGGDDSLANNLSETWEWNGATWANLNPAGGPYPRSQLGTVWDAGRKRTLLFGGFAQIAGNNSVFSDTWAYYTHGGGCSVNGDCDTGFCVDGVCCETSSCGTCSVCNGTTPGTCTPVISADDSDSCPAATSTCDSNAQCRKKTGQTCTANTDCALGNCSDGYCCNTGCGNSCDVCNATPGTCTPAAAGSAGNPLCPGSICDGSSVACPATCASDAGCSSTYYCGADSLCHASKLPSGACNLVADCKVGGCRECTTGKCVDGVCCDSACTGVCQACTAAKKGSPPDGACGTIAPGLDPDNECADQGASSCGTDGACSGHGTCELYPAGTSCGAAGCSNTTTTSQACNGSGSCVTISGANCAPFVCSAGACKTPCTSDGDCINGDYCASGACSTKANNGAACTAGNQCITSDCVDGVCCDSPCAGLCQACNATKKGSGPDGTCGAISAGTDPKGQCPQEPATSCGRAGGCDGSGACALYTQGTTCGASTCLATVVSKQQCNGFGACVITAGSDCSPFVCQSGTCGASCAGDAGCAAGNYCDSTHKCKPQLTKGSSCNPPSDCLGGACAECSTGNCVDGVCCDQTCTGLCQACTAAKKGSGSDGTCGNIVKGKDPDAECPSDPAATCQKAGGCDGAGACMLWPQNTACGSTSCVGNSVTGMICNGLGGCQLSAQGSDCAPYVCKGTTCAQPCATDTDCTSGNFCDTSGALATCVPKLANGKSCTALAPDHCASGFCADGVCCNSACDGTCQSCSTDNIDGMAGTCGFTKAAAVHRACAVDQATTCQHDGTCDGAGACRLYPAGTVCGATNCVNNTQTGYACTGTGTCDPNSTTDCKLYACKADACTTRCTDATDCSPNAYCNVDGTCKPKDGAGTTCKSGATCTSGYCVDGVCCDQACGGQCQACDLLTALGTCSPVVGGQPHADRPRCQSGGAPEAGADAASPSDICGARACDGSKSVASCVGYVGSDTSCRSQSCVNGVETFSATCDGTGFCGPNGDAKTKQCEPFSCGDTTCKASCATDADCKKGYKCEPQAGKCVTGATCDPKDDHTLVDSTGTIRTDCAPYRCDRTGGVCKTTCTTVDDCTLPNACDQAGQCTPPPAPPPASQGSGCGCRILSQSPPSKQGGAALGLIVGLVAFARRRPRRHSHRQGC